MAPKDTVREGIVAGFRGKVAEKLKPLFPHLKQMLDLKGEDATNEDLLRISGELINERQFHWRNAQGKIIRTVSIAQVQEHILKDVLPGGKTLDALLPTKRHVDEVVAASEDAVEKNTGSIMGASFGTLLKCFFSNPMLFITTLFQGLFSGFKAGWADPIKKIIAPEIAGNIKKTFSKNMEQVLERNPAMRELLPSGEVGAVADALHDEVYVQAGLKKAGPSVRQKLAAVGTGAEAQNKVLAGFAFNAADAAITQSVDAKFVPVVQGIIEENRSSTMFWRGPLPGTLDSAKEAKMVSRVIAKRLVEVMAGDGVQTAGGRAIGQLRPEELRVLLQNECRAALKEHQKQSGGLFKFNLTDAHIDRIVAEVPEYVRENYEQLTGMHTYVQKYKPQSTTSKALDVFKDEALKQAGGGTLTEGEKKKLREALEAQYPALIKTLEEKAGIKIPDEDKNALRPSVLDAMTQVIGDTPALLKPEHRELFGKKVFEKLSANAEFKKGLEDFIKKSNSPELALAKNNSIDAVLVTQEGAFVNALNAFFTTDTVYTQLRAAVPQEKINGSPAPVGRTPEEEKEYVKGQKEKLLETIQAQVLSALESSRAKLVAAAAITGHKNLDFKVADGDIKKTATALANVVADLMVDEEFKKRTDTDQQYTEIFGRLSGELTKLGITGDLNKAMADKAAVDALGQVQGAGRVPSKVARKEGADAEARIFTTALEKVLPDGAVAAVAPVLKRVIAITNKDVAAMDTKLVFEKGVPGIETGIKKGVGILAEKPEVKGIITGVEGFLTRAAVGTKVSASFKAKEPLLKLLNTHAYENRLNIDNIRKVSAACLSACKLDETISNMPTADAKYSAVRAKALEAYKDIGDENFQLSMADVLAKEFAESQVKGQSVSDEVRRGEGGDGKNAFTAMDAVVDKALGNLLTQEIGAKEGDLRLAGAVVGEAIGTVKVVNAVKGVLKGIILDEGIPEAQKQALLGDYEQLRPKIIKALEGDGGIAHADVRLVLADKITALTVEKITNGDLQPDNTGYKAVDPLLRADAFAAQAHLKSVAEGKVRGALTDTKAFFEKVVPTKNALIEVGLDIALAKQLKEAEPEIREMGENLGIKIDPKALQAVLVDTLKTHVAGEKPERMNQAEWRKQRYTLVAEALRTALVTKENETGITNQAAREVLAGKMAERFVYGLAAVPAEVRADSVKAEYELIRGVADKQLEAQYNANLEMIGKVTAAYKADGVTLNPSDIRGALAHCIAQCTLGKTGKDKDTLVADVVENQIFNKALDVNAKYRCARAKIITYLGQEHVKAATGMDDQMRLAAADELAVILAEKQAKREQAAPLALLGGAAAPALITTVDPAVRKDALEAKVAVMKKVLHKPLEAKLMHRDSLARLRMMGPVTFPGVKVAALDGEVRSVILPAAEDAVARAVLQPGFGKQGWDEQYVTLRDAVRKAFDEKKITASAAANLKLADEIAAGFVEEQTKKIVTPSKRVTEQAVMHEVIFALAYKEIGAYKDQVPSAIMNEGKFQAGRKQWAEELAKELSSPHFREKVEKVEAAGGTRTAYLQDFIKSRLPDTESVVSSTQVGSAASTLIKIIPGGESMTKALDRGVVAPYREKLAKDIAEKIEAELVKAGDLPSPKSPEALQKMDAEAAAKNATAEGRAKEQLLKELHKLAQLRDDGQRDVYLTAKGTEYAAGRGAEALAEHYKSASAGKMGTPMRDFEMVRSVKDISELAAKYGIHNFRAILENAAIPKKDAWEIWEDDKKEAARVWQQNGGAAFQRRQGINTENGGSAPAVAADLFAPYNRAWDQYENIAAEYAKLTEKAHLKPPVPPAAFPRASDHEAVRTRWAVDKALEEKNPPSELRSSLIQNYNTAWDNYAVSLFHTIGRAEKSSVMVEMPAPPPRATDHEQRRSSWPAAQADKKEKVMSASADMSSFSFFGVGGIIPTFTPPGAPKPETAPGKQAKPEAPAGR